MKATLNHVNPWSFNNKWKKIASETDVGFVESLHLMPKMSMTARDFEVGEPLPVDKSPDNAKPVPYSTEHSIHVAYGPSYTDRRKDERILEKVGKNTMMSLKLYMLIT